MKRSLLISLIPLLLVSCSNQKNDKQLELKVLCATGAPAVAFYNYANDPKFETNSNAAQGILPQIVNQNADLAILPTNVGIQAIKNKQVPYKIAATITFGNLYIASTGNDSNDTMEDGDYIVLFQQGSVPDKVFHYIYEDTLDSNIHYVSDASEAAKVLKTGKNLASNNESVDYVLLAQPALQNVLNTTPDREIYENIQDSYKNKSNGLEMFQASIFVKNSLDVNIVKSFLNSLKDDINKGLNDTNLILEGLNKSENIAVQYGVPNAELTKSVLDNQNGLGLGYKGAKENMEAIKTFASIFGLGDIDETYFF